MLLCYPYLGVILGVLHYLPPESLHGLITLTLHWKLAINVFWREDGLQVEPLSLTQEPLIEHILDIGEMAMKNVFQGMILEYIANSS